LRVNFDEQKAKKNKSVSFGLEKLFFFKEKELN